MFRLIRLSLKLALGMILLSSSLPVVYSDSFPRSAENLVVTVRDVLKSHHVVAALNKDNQSDSAKESGGAGFSGTGRAKTSINMKAIFSCAIALDASCLVDRVEDIVDNANHKLLQQADAEARRMPSGRADSGSSEEDASPSAIIQSIASMVLELPALLEESIGGMLRSNKVEMGAMDDVVGDSDEEEEEGEDGDADDDKDGKEEGDGEDDQKTDDDDEEEEEDKEGGVEEEEEAEEAEEDTESAPVQPKDDFDDAEEYIMVRKKCGKNKGGMCSQGVSSSGGGTDYGGFGLSAFGSKPSGREVGAGRKKKKKQKKKAIVKLLLLGLVLKAKLTLLLKLLAAKLQIKFLIIAFANLLINLARFWWDLKKGHGHEQPQKVIYYEHAQHQHHYDGAEDWHSSSPGGGGYWGRTSYDGQEDSPETGGSRTAQDLAYAKHLPKGTTYSRVDDKPNISWNPFG